MIEILKNLGRRDDGVAAAEFALVAPILLLLVFGMWNAGIMLFAQNGIRNAVETGARHATIFPRPDENQIREMTTQAYYGPANGTIIGPELTYGVANGLPVVSISMSYTYQPFVPFIDLPPVSLTHRRTTYLAPQGSAAS
jgi:hypothetical protein